MDELFNNVIQQYCQKTPKDLLEELQLRLPEKAECSSVAAEQDAGNGSISQAHQLSDATPNSSVSFESLSSSEYAAASLTPVSIVMQESSAPNTYSKLTQSHVAIHKRLSISSNNAQEELVPEVFLPVIKRHEAATDYAKRLQNFGVVIPKRSNHELNKKLALNSRRSSISSEPDSPKKQSSASSASDSSLSHVSQAPRPRSFSLSILEKSTRRNAEHAEKMQKRRNTL